jgi:hypothetical protein
MSATIPIHSTKLDGALQPILRSLGQFSLTKINLSKFYEYK